MLWKIYENCGIMDSKILKTIELKKGKEVNLYRKHPWLFSGAIFGAVNLFEDGELVYVQDSKKQRLGFGHFHHGSIAVKLLAFGIADYDLKFWEERLRNAFEARKLLMFKSQNTNCFRWIHGEGDMLPGLIIDIYDKTIVIQCHTIGMHKQIQEIILAIQQIFEAQDICIVDKSKDSLPTQYANSIQNSVVHGNLIELDCIEHGFRFEIDVLGGQKTGFFLDQRENRKLLSKYAESKIILNAYCYNGGFSIYALGAGAKHVSSVDVSKKALEGLKQNLRINNMQDAPHDSICADVHQFLDQMESELYDIIILDPPAFAKSIAKRHTAVQAYKRINIQAIKKIKKHGLLFSFSCSQVVSEELFYNTLVSAGIESGRNIRVLNKLSQGPDHPVNLFHPEGAYLKGLVLYVE